MTADRRTILVIDDNEVARKACSMLLEQLAFEVLQASTAEGAVAQAEARAGALTLVLADIGLPGCSVEILVRQLRGINPDVPVLYLSGHDREEPMVKRALDEESTFFLQKPVLFEILSAKIEDILSDGRDSAGPDRLG